LGKKSLTFGRKFPDFWGKKTLPFGKKSLTYGKKLPDFWEQTKSLPIFSHNTLFLPGKNP